MACGHVHQSTHGSRWTSMRSRLGGHVRSSVRGRHERLGVLDFRIPRRHIGRGATWGRIVGLTSGGPNGFPGEVSYGAAKAALENYTMSAAFELAPLGITA